MIESIWESSLLGRVNMCRWGCQTVDTTYMCRWCGTRYCAQCLRGDFIGLMKSSEKCRICLQDKCQGVRVEFIPQQSKSTSDKAPKRQKSKVFAKKKKRKPKPQKKKGKNRK